MHELRRELVEKKNDVTKRLEKVQCEMRGEWNIELFRDCLALLPELVDFGFQVEASEICETLLEHQTLAACEDDVVLAKIYRAHMDLAKQRRVERSRTFFESLLESPQAFFSAHAHSALGYLKALSVAYTEALEHFKQSAELFDSIGRPIDSLKVQLRSAMVLRFQDRYDAANALCEVVLKSATTIGVDAFSPRVIALATLGSNCKEQGKLAEAARYLKEAAKMATVLPPTLSTAYALFQYGNLLAEQKKFKDALPWLQKADSLQAYVDDLGRVNTLTVLLRCYRSLKHFDDAILVLDKLFDHKLIQVSPETLRENVLSAFALYEDLFALDRMERLFVSLFTAPPQFDKPVEEVRAAAEEHRERLRSWYERAQAIPHLQPPSKSDDEKRLCFDEGAGRLVLKMRVGQGSKFCYEEIQPRSLTSLVLLRLCELRKLGKFGLEKADTLLHIQSLASAKSDGVERQYRRVISRLKELNVIEICESPQSIGLSRETGGYFLPATGE